MVNYKVESSVSPNYLTGKAEREIPKKEKSKKKKFKIPPTKKFIYKKGNPLKKLLSQSKPTIRTRGGEPINLWK